MVEKIENQASYLCAEFDADSKTVFVFILALIVFDFYSFEDSKNPFYRKGKSIYIYICIYCVLLGGFDAINAFNQRTICSCMIFQHSCCILYIIFSINSIVFFEIFYNDVTASRDVTYFSPILMKFIQHK